jgi:hypothetical protein
VVIASGLWLLVFVLCVALSGSELLFEMDEPQLLAAAVSEQFVSEARYRRRRERIAAVEHELARVFVELLTIERGLDRWDGTDPSPERLSGSVATVEAQLALVEKHIKRLT